MARAAPRKRWRAGGEPVHLRHRERSASSWRSPIEDAVVDGLEEGPAQATARSSTRCRRTRFWTPAPGVRRRLRRLPRAPARDEDVSRRRSVRRPLLRSPPLPRTCLALSDESLQPLRRARRRGDARLKILCKDPSRFLGAHPQPHPRGDRALGDAVAAGVLPDLLGFDAGRTALRRDPESLPAGEPPGGDRPDGSDDLAGAPGQLRPDRRAPGRVRRRGARQLPGALPELRLSGRGRRSACSCAASESWSSGRPTATSEREPILQALRSRDLRRRPAARGGRRASSPRGSTIPATCCTRWPSSVPACPRSPSSRSCSRPTTRSASTRGFEYAFVVPGMTRVVQAAGRLIRSPRRLGRHRPLRPPLPHPPYRDYLPADGCRKTAPPASSAIPRRWRTSSPACKCQKRQKSARRTCLAGAERV